MSMNYNVQIIFNDGSGSYTLPYVFHVSDPEEGIKHTRIEGKRASGCIIIPGGKKSHEITVSGNLLEDDYKDITTAMNTLRSNVTTKSATLTMRHKEGVKWITDWQYTVRRLGEIEWPESLRTNLQEYSITFLVTEY